MFSNLNWWNVAVLLLLALFIFGDKLPQAISDGLRLLRNLRRMARNATTDLSRELGTDIQLEDLHPKTFIRKHVLSEEDQEALVRPLKGLSEDLAAEARGVEREIRDVHQQVAEPAGPASRRARGTRGSRTNGTSTAVGSGTTGSEGSPNGGAGGSPNGGPAGSRSDGRTVAGSPNGESAAEPATPPAPRRSLDDIT